MSSFISRKTFLSAAVIVLWSFAQLFGWFAAGIAYAGNGAVSNVVFSVSPPDGSGYYTWTVGFTTSETGTLNIYDDMAVTVPNAMLSGRDMKVVVNGSTQSVATGTVRYSGNKIVFANPHYLIGALTDVQIVIRTQTVPKAGTYPAADFAVSTYSDTMPAHPAANVTIPKATASSVEEVTFAAIPPKAGAESEWVVSFQTSVGGKLTTGLETVTISGPAGTQFSNRAVDYTVNGVAVSHVETPSAHTAVVTVPAEAFFLDDRHVSIIAKHTVNPSAAGEAEEYGVHTSLDTIPAHPAEAIRFMSSVGHVRFSADPAYARATGSWVVSFAATGGLSEGDRVYITAPEGANFPADRTAYTINGSVPSAVELVDGYTNRVRLTVPTGDSGRFAGTGEPVTVAIQGVGNPPAGVYQNYEMQVWTDVDLLWANAETSLVFSNQSAGAVSGVTFSPNSTDEGEQAVWTVRFVTGSAGALRPFADTITVSGPAGTVFSASPADYRVNGAAVGSVNVSGGNTVVIALPVPVPNAAETTVIAPVEINPPSGYYGANQFAVATSVDVIPGHPPTDIAFGAERASLRSLAVRDKAGNAVSLRPEFSYDVTSYGSTVANSVSSIEVIPTAVDGTATVEVNGEALASGSASRAISLRVGDNTISVDVAAQDGAVKKTYTLQVNRRTYIPPAYYPVTGVSVDQTELVLPVGGEPIALQATVYPSYASNQSVTWSSSDPQVAEVNERGIVTPLAPGRATITVTTVDQGKTATCQVEVVKAVELVGLKPSDKTILLQPNKSSTFKLYAVYSDGTKEDITKDKRVKYSASSKTKATVTAGLVKAGKREGKATITISYRGFKAKIPVIISKLEVKKLELQPASLQLDAEQKEQLEVKATLSDTSTQDVTELATWSSSDPEVADVDDNGKLTAIAPGTAVITATYGGQTSGMNVEVSGAKQVKRLTASKRTVNVSAGKEQTVKLTAYYQDGSKKTVTELAEWWSEDEAVAVVKNGVIAGRAKGTAMIKGKYQGKTVTIMVSVQE